MEQVEVSGTQKAHKPWPRLVWVGLSQWEPTPPGTYPSFLITLREHDNDLGLLL